MLALILGDILTVLKKVVVSGVVEGVDWRRPVKGLNVIEEAMVVERESVVEVTSESVINVDDFYFLFQLYF